MGFQPVAAVFAADAGLFEAAKRRQGFVRRAVDHHTAAFQPLGYLTCVRHISALDIGLQAVGCVVGDGDRLVFVVVGDDAQHRAEDLFAGDAHVVVDAGEDGRLDEPSPVEADRPAFAADEKLSAFLETQPDVALHPVPLLLTDHRPDVHAAIGGIADLEGRNRCL